MPTRDERRAAAAKNLALMRGAFAGDTAKTIENAKIYEDGEGRELELPEVEEGAVTTTSVTSDFAVKALHAAHGKVVLVDPCSFTRPGGAYEDGAFGPEQILCSESNLYPVLQGCKSAYHDANRGFASGQLFTDRAVPARCDVHARWRDSPRRRAGHPRAEPRPRAGKPSQRARD